MSTLEMTDKAIAAILDKVTASSVLLPEALQSYVTYRIVAGIMGYSVSIVMLILGCWLVVRATKPFYNKDINLDDTQSIMFIITIVVGVVTFGVGVISIMTNYDSWLAGFFPDALMMDYIKNWTKLK